jgi:hypothetical protein
MIKEMKGWKVIKRASRSSVCGYGDFNVYYPLNVETFPKIKGSKLFFFKNREDAVFYNNYYTIIDCIIAPCIARNVTKHKWMCSLSYLDQQEQQIKDFWASRKHLLNRTPVIDGTLLAESITCLE